MFEIVAKIMNMKIFEQSEDDIEMNEEDNKIIKQMKEKLAMKDFQLESMKSKIEAIEKRNKIYVNRRQILTTNLNFK